MSRKLDLCICIMINLTCILHLCMDVTPMHFILHVYVHRAWFPEFISKVLLHPLHRTEGRGRDWFEQLVGYKAEIFEQ